MDPMLIVSWEIEMMYGVSNMPSNNLNLRV